MEPIYLRRDPGEAAIASARQPLRHGVSNANTGDLSEQKFDSQLRLLLASGGDERIWPDPATGRNKYGTPIAPAADEIWFSSSTAAAITPLAYREAGQILKRLITTERRDRIVVAEWFETIRNRILHLFGVPGAMAVLTASGTEAELLALCVAQGAVVRPLVNIVIAPGETGSGVIRAAAGTHFLGSTSLACPVTAGTKIAGLETAPISVETVEIRDQFGVARESAEIDREVGQRVLRALQGGHDVLVHLLDTSKTGLNGLSRPAAEAMARSAPDRVIVIVDACQLRCPASQIRADLGRGYMVQLTGSKFAGGPPFSGALLLPQPLIGRMQSSLLPDGLAAYSAYHDWPAKLLPDLSLSFMALANLGMGLRWEAALFELERFADVSASVSHQIVKAFATEVKARVNAANWLALLDPGREAARLPTIISVLPARQPSLAYAEYIHRALRSPNVMSAAGDKICHLGQPVLVGARAALRFCASAPLISAVAQRMEIGLSLEAALAPVRADLDCVFRKWEALSRA